MKKSAFLLLISIIAVLALAACGNSSPAQTGAPQIPTSNAGSGQSSSQSTSSQSSSQSTSNQSSTQQISVSVSSSSNQNSATINVNTLPGATITIDLSYCGQSSQKTAQADSSGNYTLNWTPDKSCGGMVTATVTASSGGQSATGTTSFSVS